MSQTLKTVKLLDKHLKVVKAGDDASSLELGSQDNGARISGDLDINGNTKVSNGDVTIDSAKKIYLDSGGDTYIYEHSADDLRFVVGDSIMLRIVENGGSGNDFLHIPSTTKFYLDGGTDTYIQESSADVLRFVVGDDAILTMTEAGAGGNLADFGTTGVGFTQGTVGYDATNTNVYFSKEGNKAFLTFGAGNITNMNIYFPPLACNCILLIKQDGTGSRTVTNWKTFDSEGGNESTVVFAGGSNPTLTTTANKLDIVSFYWDGGNRKAYGTVSQNF